MRDIYPDIRHDMKNYILQKQQEELDRNNSKFNKITSPSEKFDPQDESDNQPGSKNGYSNFASQFGALSGGVMGIVDNFQNLSDIADTSGYWDDINEVENLGMSNYYDIDALSQDYARMANLNQMYDYSDIRGKNDGELAMGVGSSMLQGAAAGASFGPYGAAAGAAIGLGAGLAGMFSGNRKARREQRYLEDRAEMAVNGANKNLNAAHEQLRDYQFRSGVSNRAADGGRIVRKNQSLQEFADKIFNRQRTNDSSRSVGIVRTHCNGGTMIRIKR